MNKEGSFGPIFFALAVSLLIAMFWNSISFIKNIVHTVFDPSLGSLLNWNLTVGMLIIIAILSLITTLVQKYTTDQKTLKEMKKEQKLLQEEMKKYRDNPQKLMELQKKSFEFMPKTFKLSMRSFAFTAIPLILFFRWFTDFFQIMGSPKFFGFMGWIWFYLIGSIIFSSIFRKWFDVV
jgi:uncharacterized membrane protein (DUF106 family)